MGRCSRRGVRPSTLATYRSSVRVFHWQGSALRLGFGVPACLPSPTACRISLTVSGSKGRLFVPLEGLALVSRCSDRHRCFGQLPVHRLIEGFIHFNPILHQFYESLANAGLLIDPGQYLLGRGDIPN